MYEVKRSVVNRERKKSVKEVRGNKKKLNNTKAKIATHW